MASTLTIMNELGLIFMPMYQPEIETMPQDQLRTL